MSQKNTMSEKTFVNGLFYKSKHEKAPDFVLCSLSAKREDLIAFLQSQSDEWINMDVLTSKKSGKPYIVVNEYKKQEDQVVSVQGEVNTEDIPF